MAMLQPMGIDLVLRTRERAPPAPLSLVLICLADHSL